MDNNVLLILVMFFCSGTKEVATCLRSFLDRFGETSGLHVNAAKSVVFVGVCVWRRLLPFVIF